MAKGQAFTGEILHFGAIRLRLNGSGNFRLFLNSLDSVENATLVPVVMSTTTNREPTVLSNFAEQRAFIEGTTTDINETFTISKLIVYIKPIFSGYPQ